MVATPKGDHQLFDLFYLLILLEKTITPPRTINEMPKAPDAMNNVLLIPVNARLEPLFELELFELTELSLSQDA